MGEIARRFGNPTDWGNPAHVYTVKILAGETICVGNRFDALKERKVNKDFIFIQSKAQPLLSRTPEEWTLFDTSVFSGKIASFHGIRFPNFIGVRANGFTIEDIHLNQTAVQKAVDSLLHNASKKSLEETTKVRIMNSRFVLTGKAKWTRAVLTAKIEAKGGTVEPRIAGHITYLVTDDLKSTTTKARDAASHGIEVITYDDLYKYL